MYSKSFKLNIFNQYKPKIKIMKTIEKEIRNLIKESENCELEFKSAKGGFSEKRFCPKSVPSLSQVCPKSVLR